MSITRACLVLLIAASLTLAGCAPPAASTEVISADQAVRLVLAQRADFAGIGPLDPNLIGQAAWYEVAEAGDGWQVLVRIGWGDCPAGCISQHRWTYGVERDGSVELLAEDGDELVTEL